MSEFVDPIESQHVTRIVLADKEIVLVGTAHVSKESAKLVREVIERERPDTVAIELCASRYQALTNPEVWKQTDIFQILKEGKASVLITQLALSGFQKRIAKKLGVEPGVEMKEAIAVAKEMGAHIGLIDRNIKTTLKRAWRKTSWSSFFRIFLAYFDSLLNPKELSEQEVEAMLEGDTLTAMVTEFSEILPSIKEVLIDERDSYLAEKIRREAGKKVVAIVGAGHITGIRKHIGKEIDLEPLDMIPPPSKLGLFLGWGLPALIIASMVFGFLNSGSEKGSAMVMEWVLATGGLSAIAAVISLAHPLTILSAFIAAPFTILHPMIAVGGVCGLVEAYLRKPQVRDFETIGEDITTIKGIYRNKISRVLLVFFVTNLGAVLGAALGVVGIGYLLGSA